MDGVYDGCVPLLRWCLCGCLCLVCWCCNVWSWRLCGSELPKAFVLLTPDQFSFFAHGSAYPKELRFRQCSLYHSVCFQWDQCVSELSVPPIIDGFRCPQSKNITCSGHLVTISNQLLVKPSPGAPSFQTNLKPSSTTLSEPKKMWIQLRMTYTQNRCFNAKTRDNL